jgi:hypothetical protein
LLIVVAASAGSSGAISSTVGIAHGNGYDPLCFIELRLRGNLRGGAADAQYAIFASFVGHS